MKKVYILLCFTLCSAWVANAQFTTLVSFNDASTPKGKWPRGSLALSSSGTVLYGMTEIGASWTYGNIFSVNTNGSGYKDLHDFAGNDGEYPVAAVTILGNQLYGMASSGGGLGKGCIFSIDTNGTGYTDIHDFNGTNGANPYGSLTLSGSTFFGTTYSGGTRDSGCVFSIHTNGSGYKVLLNFNNTNGKSPEGSLTLSVSGTVLYGMADGGGANGKGVIFSMDTNGNGYKNLHSFNGINGANPAGSLTLLGNTLFGMTAAGGAHGDGCIFSIDTNGTGYRDLFDFSGGVNGYEPLGDLTFVGNTLYAMTYLGGAFSHGNIFCIDTNGSGYRDLFDFSLASNGGDPWGSLTPSLSGSLFYGMTQYGGANSDGLIFSMDTNVLLSAARLKSNINKVSLYPNPNNGVFTLQISAEKESSGREIEIYNVLGEKIYTAPLPAPEKETSTSTISIKGQAQNGIYFYRIISSDNKELYSGKFIITQ